VEPARVSSPQVDLTRYGLDKTPTLLQRIKRRRRRRREFNQGSNPANRPGPQNMPECRFNEYNATSKILRGKPTRCHVIPGRPAL